MPQVQLISAVVAANGQPAGATAGKPLRGATAPIDANFSDHDVALVLVKSTAGSGVMTTTIRLWGYSAATAEWHPIGIGTAANPDTARGVLNGGSAIGEITADKLQHAELVSGLRHFDRIYAEVAAIGGTLTAVEVWLVNHLGSNW